MISKQSTIVASKDQISSDLAGEAVILNLKNGDYYGLDDVGAHVWNLIQQPARVNDICDALLKEYEVERDQCERDLLALLQELAAEGLIEVKNDADT